MKKLHLFAQVVFLLFVFSNAANSKEPYPYYDQNIELNLLKGYNLVSVPGFYASVLNSADCGIDNYWTLYKGKYVNNKIYDRYIQNQNPETNLNLLAFFVHAKKKCTLKLSVKEALSMHDLGSYNLDLNKGWNMVAGLSDSPDIKSITGNCKILKGPFYYDAVNKKWVQSAKLEKGIGYIVKVAQDCQLGLDSESVYPPDFPS